VNPALSPSAQVRPPDGTDPLRAAALIRDLLYARLVSHALTSMAEFQVADHLASGPLHVSVLADRAQLDGEALYRLLRALAAFGIVSQESPKVFALTPLGQAMRSDAPGTAYPTAALIGEVMGPAWNELSSVLRTGKAAFPEVFGSTFYSYLENNKPVRAIFDASQEAGLALELPGILASLALSTKKELVDVGAGDGAVSAALLGENPRLRATLIDGPSALSAANDRLARSNLLHRATLRDGDFFQQMPPGGDLYLFRHIMHNWDDRACVLLLDSCRKAMAPHGTVAIIEFLINEDQRADESGRASAVMDLYMMTLFGPARERTADEFGNLLSEAGLRPFAISYLPTGAGVIQASAMSDA
jgi:hypothetical protein